MKVKKPLIQFRKFQAGSGKELLSFNGLTFTLSAFCLKFFREKVGLVKLNK